ncbi:unnamed protein product [Arctogadus glacialis]
MFPVAARFKVKPGPWTAPDHPREGACKLDVPPLLSGPRREAVESRNCRRGRNAVHLSFNLNMISIPGLKWHSPHSPGTRAHFLHRLLLKVWSGLRRRRAGASG